MAKLQDPFAPKPEPDVLTSLAVVKPHRSYELSQLNEDDIYYHKMVGSRVCKYKNESGVPVKVEDLGSIKDYFQIAVQKAALLSPRQMEQLDFSDMTHLEIAAVRVAAFAAAGDLKSAQELFDRMVGKSKMVMESTQLSLTIDDVLAGVKEKIPEGVIDV